MARIDLFPATTEHAAELLAEMRALDLAEVTAATGPDVLRATMQGIALSYQPVAARVEGELLCLFGIAPLTVLGDTASPWVLGTDRMTRNAGGVLRIAFEYIRWARQFYPKLVNHVDARNAPSIRWLKRVGFTLDPATPYGVARLPFHRFHMGLDSV